MFNVTTTLKLNLVHSVMFLQIELDQYLTFFLSEQYLLAYLFSLKKLSSALGKS